MRYLLLILFTAGLVLASCKKDEARTLGNALVTYKLTGKSSGNVYDVYLTDQDGNMDTLKFQTNSFSENVGVPEGKNRTLEMRVVNTISDSDTDLVTIEIQVDGKRRGATRGRTPQSLTVVIP
jgi:sporulation protein YlmC with PRC-barrel domain